MIINEFTIGSPITRESDNLKTFPIGAGLIFIANQVKDFGNFKQYLKLQTKQDYEKWS